eukprot:jgi/Chrpa1/1589/Chrysochromulina_OHIO_Genome00021054-RA
MLLQSLTVERFGDPERLALRRGVAALVGDLQSASTAPPMVTLTIEPASVRATAVVFAPNRTVATSYVEVLAAQTPQSLSAAIAVHYTGTSVLTVDALEGPFSRAVTRQTLQPPALPSPAPSPPSCFVFENCPFGLPPPLPDILFFGLLKLAILGFMLLWYLIRRRRRNIEQERKAQMAQRAAQEKTAAVSLQARARSWLAKRTRQRAHAATEAREAAAARAAARLQAHVRSTLQMRKMKRDSAAKSEAERLERAARAATTLQRGVRLAALRRAVRGRAVEAKLAQMRTLAESVVQTHARRSLSPTEAAPKLHSFCSSPGWSPAATTFRSPDVPSPLPRTLSYHGGRPAPFASGDVFTPPRHAGVSSTPRAGSSQPAAIRRTPTLSERGSASHAATVHV